MITERICSQCGAALGAERSGQLCAACERAGGTLVAEATVPLRAAASPEEGKAPVAVLTPGQQLGAVRIVRELGRGAMGIVYLGHDTVLARHVAVKVMSSGSTGAEPAGFGRFLEEARAAAVVRHPHLVQVYHAEVADEVPYLVMEYVEGLSLKELLGRCGALELPGALAMLTDICEAVAELHDRGIIHRDIKPGNVLMADTGQVYVSDFGLALRRSAEGFAGGVAGTPAYMAPEMFDGRASPRSDVYALGIMAFEMLTGRLPFVGPAGQVRQKHQDEPLPSHLLRARAVPEPVIEAIERAANKSVLFRYKTPRDFLRALRDAAGVRPAGRMDLRALVVRCGAAAEGKPAAPPPPSSGQLLSRLVVAKRQMRRDQGADPQDGLSRKHMLPCVKCGWDVGEAYPSAACCPQCGMPMERILDPGRLMFRPASALGRMFTGHLLILLAPGLALASMLMAILQRVALPGGPEGLFFGIGAYGGGGLLLPGAALVAGALESRRWKRALLVMIVITLIAWFVAGTGPIAGAALIGLAAVLLHALGEPLASIPAGAASDGLRRVAAVGLWTALPLALLWDVAIAPSAQTGDPLWAILAGLWILAAAGLFVAAIIVSCVRVHAVSEYRIDSPAAPADKRADAAAENRG